MKTLKARLGMGLALTQVAAAALLLFLVTGAIRGLLEGYLESRLSRDAEVLLAAVELTPDRPPSLRAAHLDALYEQPFSGRYFRITVEGNTLRSRSLWDADLAVYAPLPGKPVLRRNDGPQGQSLFVYAAAYQKRNQSIVVTVGEDVAHIDAAVHALQRDYLIIASVVAAFLVLFQTIVVQRSLRPLEFVRQRLRAYQKGESGEIRVDGPGEILPLVDEINRLGDVTQRRLQRHRRALGNLAHSLKTPLTLLIQLADRADMTMAADDRNLLRDQTTAIEKLVQRELRRARFAAASSGGVVFDVAAELKDLITVLRLMHADKAVDVRLDVATTLRAPFDREDMLELFGNLLDNACKWAAGVVRVGVVCDGALLVEIEDDGPGSPDDQMERLTHRGMRFDEQTTGHGLGLAIVKDLVDDYGGEIKFDRSSILGGLRVKVRLPLE